MAALDTTGRLSLGDLMDQISGAMTLGSLDQPQSHPAPRRRIAAAQRDRQEQQTLKDQQIRQLVNDVSRSFSFELSGMGSYPGGASFDEVLGYLADIGKDFLHISPNMRRQVKAALVAAFDGRSRVPSQNQMQRVAGAAILAVITARLENRLRDVRIRANKDAYTRLKFKEGYDSRVGVRTGSLLEAVKDARVEIQTD